MDELKSARELAMERIAKMTAARQTDPAAKLRWEYEPKGQEIAARFLNNDKEKLDLISELASINNDEGSKVAKRAMADVFINNVALVDNLHERRQVERALTGLREITEDKDAFDAINSDLMDLYQHNATEGNEQRKQLKEALTSSYMQQLERLKQQGIEIDMQKMVPENSHEFQQQYRHYLNEIDGRYRVGIDDVKNRFAELK